MYVKKELKRCIVDSNRRLLCYYMESYDNIICMFLSEKRFHILRQLDSGWGVFHFTINTTNIMSALDILDKNVKYYWDFDEYSEIRNQMIMWCNLIPSVIIQCGKFYKVKLLDYTTYLRLSEDLSDEVLRELEIFNIEEVCFGKNQN